MHIISSRRGIKLPLIYFVSDREEIQDIPIGIPYIYGDKEEEENIRTFLEYEVLYESAIKTGLPFNFKILLEEAGFKDLCKFDFYHPVAINFDGYRETEIELLKEELSLIDDGALLLKDYIKDTACYVSIEKLRNLGIIPVCANEIEDAIKTNIVNFISYNPYMYNKKLDGMYGGLELLSPSRNLIIIDISGSIPKGVSSVCLAYAKHLSQAFFADVMITGSKTTLYPYEEIHRLDIKRIYKENGMDNDQRYFLKIVSEERHYDTCVVFGDNHSPSMNWSNSYNKKTKFIPTTQGIKLNKFKIKKLISFHTDNRSKIAGYAEWFDVKEVKHISNWVKYF